MVYTDPEHTPAGIARALLEMGVDARAHVAERLGEEDERVRSFAGLKEVAEERFLDPNVLILEAKGPLPPRLGFFPDEAFEQRMPKKGLITKREVRLLALGLLGLPRTGSFGTSAPERGAWGLRRRGLPPGGRSTPWRKPRVLAPHRGERPPLRGL